MCITSVRFCSHSALPFCVKREVEYLYTAPPPAFSRVCPSPCLLLLLLPSTHRPSPQDPDMSYHSQEVTARRCQSASFPKNAPAPSAPVPVREPPSRPSLPLLTTLSSSQSGWSPRPPSNPDYSACLLSCPQCVISRLVAKASLKRVTALFQTS